MPASPIAAIQYLIAPVRIAIRENRSPRTAVSAYAEIPSSPTQTPSPSQRFGPQFSRAAGHTLPQKFMYFKQETQVATGIFCTVTTWSPDRTASTSGRGLSEVALEPPFLASDTRSQGLKLLDPGVVRLDGGDLGLLRDG